MIRKMLCISCVLALVLCAALLPERYEKMDSAADTGVSRPAVRTPRALREAPSSGDMFITESNESEAEWKLSWERALSIGDGEAEEAADLDLADFDWSGFGADMGAI